MRAGFMPAGGEALEAARAVWTDSYEVHDPGGETLACIDDGDSPEVVHLARVESAHVDRFTPDGHFVVPLGLRPVRVGPAEGTHGEHAHGLESELGGLRALVGQLERASLHPPRPWREYWGEPVCNRRRSG